MRCRACNCILTDQEATRKYTTVNDFVELCDHCYSTIEEDLPTLEGNKDDGNTLNE